MIAAVEKRHVGTGEVRMPIRTNWVKSTYMCDKIKAEYCVIVGSSRHV